MSKGPRLNNISRNFTTRNSLGIDEVANSISGELCPIVNSVTPRPFYWAFITWCYYDVFKNCDPKDRNSDNVYKYVKMQNYFLALASDISYCISFNILSVSIFNLNNSISFGFCLNSLFILSFISCSDISLFCKYITYSL